MPVRPALEVAIDPALRGQMVAPGAPIQVAGKVLGPAAAGAALTVDGRPVALAADGSFAAKVTARRGIQSIRIEAADRAGHAAQATLAALAGSFIPEGSSHPAGAAVRVNRAALAALEAPMAAAVAQVALGQQIARANPLFSASDWWGSVEASATAGRFDTPSVRLDPKPGALGAAVTIRNLRVDFDVDYRSFLAARISGSVTAQMATIAADLVATADPAGTFHVQAGNTTVSFSGFQLSLTAIPFVDQLLRGEVERQVTAGIRRAVAQELPPALESALHMLTAPQARRVFGGLVVSMVFRPEAVVHDADGIEVRLSTLFVAPRSPLVAPAPGSLGAAKPLPPLGRTSGFSFALSDGFFDQILYTLWRGGLLSLPIDAAAMREINPAIALDSDLVRFYFPSLRGAVPAGLAVTVRLDPRLPPVLALPSAGGATQADLALGDLGLSIEIDPGGGARPIEVVRGVAQVRIPTDVAVRGDFARLEFDAALAEASVDLSSTPLGPVPRTELEGFVRDLLPQVLGALAAQIQGFRMPAPTVAGITLRAAGAAVGRGMAPGDASIVISGDYR